MKKLLLVALLVLFATQNARAEKDGFFFGAAFPIVGLSKTKNEASRKYQYYRFYNAYNAYEYTTTDYYYDEYTHLAIMNVAFGYTHALGERLGLRYYGSFYLNAEIINADFLNVDVLFSVVKGENAELRVFAGGWLGWVSYFGYYHYYERHIEGLDFGLNAGLRFVLAQRHGFDFYGRFGFMTQSGEEYTDSYGLHQRKASQPYLIGFRYTISF